jgi:hypothetical protein
MKCPRCWAQNLATDTVCVGCGRKMVVQYDQPQWSYLFATVCGIIPIVALGGIIPITLGLTGASGCLGVSRMGNMPVALRLLACVGITVVCWGLFLLMLGAVLAEAKH